VGQVKEYVDGTLFFNRASLLPVNKYGLARIPEIRARAVIYTFDNALLNTTLATDAILCKKDHILELPLSCL
jgi:hypothetical protein